MTTGAGYSLARHNPSLDAVSHDFPALTAIHQPAKNKETYGFPLSCFLSYSTLQVGRGACLPGISTG
jgi:hypothetical protein